MGRPDGFERWRETLASMRTDGYGMKRMSRETRLSYNTVKKYLERMDAEGDAGAAGGKEGTVIVSHGTGGTLARGVEVEVVGKGGPEEMRDG